MGNILAQERALECPEPKWRIMKRRINRTPIYLAEVPSPLDPGTEVLYEIDARQKLQAAIESENRNVSG